MARSIYFFINFLFFLALPLEAFGKVIWQLMQDVQERLVFRAHLYLQSDILNYKPSPGDLAYPEKLEMMEVFDKSVVLIMIAAADLAPF